MLNDESQCIEREGGGEAGDMKWICSRQMNEFSLDFPVYSRFN